MNVWLFGGDEAVIKLYPRHVETFCCFLRLAN